MKISDTGTSIMEPLPSRDSLLFVQTERLDEYSISYLTLSSPFHISEPPEASLLMDNDVAWTFFT